MKFSSRHIVIIVLIITAALIGVISVQISLLYSVFEQKQQIFDQNVIGALSVVSQKLESSEVAGKVFSVAIQSGNGRTMARVHTLHGKDSVLLEQGSPAVAMLIDSLKQLPGRVASVGKGEYRIEVKGSPEGDSSVSVNINETSGASVSSGKAPTGYWYNYSTSDSHVVSSVGRDKRTTFVFADTTSAKKKELVAKVVDRLVFTERLPLEKRIDPDQLDSLLRTSLENAGIDIPFHYGVFLGESEYLKFTNDSSSAGALRASSLKTVLFPTDIMTSPYQLAVLFPDRGQFVLKQMAMLGLLSALFIIVIVFGFVYTIRTIIRQKLFSASIVDFINNMTHEFKTPISTIALATEAIGKPEVSRVRKKLLQYNNIIVEEAARMRIQVEKILQMAVIEEGNIALKYEPVDMHQVVARAVKHIALQVEHRKGMIEADYRANVVEVMGEKIHLENIIHNLLENALKYSPEVPIISLITMNDGDRLVIRISDKGIGMSEEQKQRVFEKYYRVPTGNTHNVKGFGLGLSYVKLMTEAHGGTVALESIPGKGTIVELRFPLRP